MNTSNSPNLNRMRHGERINRLTLGTLPNIMRRQLAAARRYRTGLEQIVLGVKGEVSITDAHYIDEAVTAEVHAAINRWLLRSKLEKMTTQDISRCSEQILKAKTVRNKAFERLGLDRVEANTIEALYSVKGDDKAAHSPPVALFCGEASNVPANDDNALETRHGVCDDCDGEGCPTCQRSQHDAS